MKKGFAVVLAMVMVMALVGSVMAERYSVTTVEEITVLGKPAAVIKTVDKGGPSGGGFMGTTRIFQTTVTVNKKGELEKLSEFGSQSDGFGKAMLQGVPQAAMLGGMQIIAAGQIRPDRTSVNVPVSQSNKNVQAQGQLQGQMQGQAQGQAQGQVGINSGFVPPGQDK